MKRKIFSAVLTAVLVTIGTSQAFAAEELEPNDSIGTAQQLSLVDGSVSVNGGLGVVSPEVGGNYVDFYTFFGSAGELVTLDIDAGIGGTSDVDTVIGLFAADGSYSLLSTNDNTDVIDDGSTSTLDARIDDFALPSTGYFVVGVTVAPRYFVDGGATVSPARFSSPFGDYRLTIALAPVPTPDPEPAPAPEPAPTPDPVPPALPATQIKIDIRPGKKEPARVPSKGTIVVAILSSSTFDALHEVNTASLSFGKTGDEKSLYDCARRGRDVNGDGLRDLVCRFRMRATNLMPGDTVGVLRGVTLGGVTFEGRDLIKTVGKKKSSRHD